MLISLTKLYVKLIIYLVRNLNGKTVFPSKKNNSEREKRKYLNFSLSFYSVCIKFLFLSS